MSRTIIATTAAPPAPSAYSQAVRAAGLVFVSGTAPIDPRTGKIVEGSVQQQVAQCLANISAILVEAGIRRRSTGAAGRQNAGAHPWHEGLDRVDR